MPERLAERVWISTSQSSLLNIYFRLSKFQSSFLLIHFRYGPNTCSHQSVAQDLSDMWRSTFEIGPAQPRTVTDIAAKSPNNMSRSSFPRICALTCTKYGFTCNKVARMPSFLAHDTSRYLLRFFFVCFVLLFIYLFIYSGILAWNIYKPLEPRTESTTRLTKEEICSVNRA